MNTVTLPPRHHRLSTRCALLLLVAMLLASLVGLLAWGPVGWGTYPHRFTDQRVVAGLVNGWSVWLQLPLMAAAVAGVCGPLRRRNGSAMERAWRMFFALAALAALASIADHLATTPAGYVLSKLPTASACSVLSLLFIAERAGPRWLAPGTLGLAVASGPIAGLLHFTALASSGQPDLRWLWMLEHLPVLLIAMGVWGLRSRGLSGRDWLIALLWFAVAKLVDMLDEPLWQWSGGAVTGHALHHLPLAACLAWLAWRTAYQAAGARAGARSGAAGPRLASNRSTSLNTSG